MVNTLSPQRNYREISNYLLLSTLIGLTAVIGTALFQFALPQPQYVNLGPASIFEQEQPVLVRDTSRSGPIVVWVVNIDGIYHAFEARSPHHYCHNELIQWEAEKKLWNHYKNYFIDCVGTVWQNDGTYQLGPGLRNLDWYPVEIRDDGLWIDITSKQTGSLQK